MSATVNKSSKVKKASDIYALSEYLGLSVGTISNVFNRPEIVAEKTRTKVLDGASKLGYKPNYFARGLGGGKTMTIGLVTELSNSTSINQSRSLIRAAESGGYLTHLIDTYRPGDDSAYMMRRIQDLLDRKVDGLIVLRSRPATDEVKQFLEKHCDVPIVFVGAGHRDIANSIFLDGEPAIDDLAQHLYELGHRRVAYLASAGEYDSLDHKIRTYQRAFLKRNMDFVIDKRWMINGQAKDLADDAYRVVTNCLKEDKAITALLMNNDIGAMGAFSATGDMNLKVPDDISIVGFDDITGAKHLHTPLTTIRPPAPDQIGAASFNMLHTLIEDPQAQIEKQVFPFKLVVRDSTGRKAGQVLTCH